MSHTPANDKPANPFLQASGHKFGMPGTLSTSSTNVPPLTSSANISTPNLFQNISSGQGFGFSSPSSNVPHFAMGTGTPVTFTAGNVLLSRKMKIKKSHSKADLKDVNEDFDLAALENVRMLLVCASCKKSPRAFAYFYRCTRCKRLECGQCTKQNSSKCRVCQRENKNHMMVTDTLADRLVSVFLTHNCEFYENGCREKMHKDKLEVHEKGEKIYRICHENCLL